MTGQDKEKEETAFFLELSESNLNYLKVISAFANTYGGNVVFGRDSAGNLEGLESAKTIEWLTKLPQVINQEISPAVTARVYIRDVAGRSLLVVSVAPGLQTPYFVKSLGVSGGTFIRLSGRTYQATGFWLKELILAGRGRSFDSEPVSGDYVNEEKLTLLNTALRSARTKFLTLTGILPPPFSALTENSLLALGLVRWQSGYGVLTQGVSLLLGQVPGQAGIELELVLPNGEIQKSLAKGGLVKQLVAAIEHWQASIKRYPKLVIIPTAALYQVLATAILHRSHFSPRNVRFTVRRDSLELLIPAFHHNRIPLEKLAAGFFRPRHLALTRLFHSLGLVPDFGSGLARLQDSCKAVGLKAIELSANESGDLKILVYGQGVKEFEIASNKLKLSNRLAKLNGNAMKVLEILKNNPTMEQTEIQKEMQVSLKKVKKALSDLENCGAIRQDPVKNWEVFC